MRVLALRVLLDHLPEGGEGLAGGARGALREVGAEEVLDQIRRALEVDQPLDVISIVDARMSGILADEGLGGIGGGLALPGAVICVDEIEPRLPRFVGEGEAGRQLLVDLDRGVEVVGIEIVPGALVEHLGGDLLLIARAVRAATPERDQSDTQRDHAAAHRTGREHSGKGLSLASRRFSARSIANPPGPLPTTEAPPEFRSHALTLPRADAGLRFDRALARALPQYSRALLKSWIESGAVQVDGRAPRPRDKVQGGEEVRIEAQLATQTPVRPEAIPLEVIHEDRALIIINKPAGLVVHPGAGNARHTLQNALLALDPKLARVPRAGLVHRLDKDTSGLLVVARTPEAHAALVAALVAREIGRQYLAVCTGAMTAGGTVDEPIGRHRIHRTRMAVRADGRRALTRYRIVQRFRAHTLVRVELETGRTHQIRVHLAHIGFPIVGDPVYGGRRRIPAGCAPELAAALRAFPRQALHAALLELTHPTTGRRLEWQAPPPEDMQRLLEALRKDPT